MRWNTRVALTRTAIVVSCVVFGTNLHADEFPKAAQLEQETSSTMMVWAKRRDGSTVNGRLVDGKPLSLRTSFAHDQIPLHLVQAMRLNKNLKDEDLKTVVVQFRNGDRLTGSLDNKLFKVKSKLGELDVVLADVTQFQLWVPVSLPAKLRESLSLHYSFDDGRAFDLSGNMIHGEIHGAKPTMNGRHGGGLQFESDDYVEIGNPMSLRLRTVTVAAWIRFANDRRENKFWISKGQLNERGADYAFQVFSSGAQVWSYVDDVEKWQGAVNRQPTVDMWLHVIATYDGAGKALHYINGKNIPHRENKALGKIPDRYTWKVGVWDKQRFAGTADEVMIFDRALPTDEVKQLYEAVK